MNIRISIIMGIYNCATTLSEAIESIIAQTYTGWKLIMCDDGSSDNTADIAKIYCKRYPDKIFLIRNEKNMGLNFTLNHCLEYADTEYVARMDGDDISLSTRLEKEVAFLDSHQEYAIVSTPMIFFDENGIWKVGKSINRPNLKDFATHSPVHCHAPCMIRTEAYKNVGGYTVDKRFLRYEDVNLWYKLYSAGYRGYNLDEPLYKMRDDKNAYHRRSPSSRLRGVYVQCFGFRMIHMPIKYYPYLVLDFIKSMIKMILPYKIYLYFHQKG